MSQWVPKRFGREPFSISISQFPRRHVYGENVGVSLINTTWVYVTLPKLDSLCPMHYTWILCQVLSWNQNRTHVAQPQILFRLWVTGCIVWKGWDFEIYCQPLALHRIRMIMDRLLSFCWLKSISKIHGLPTQGANPGPSAQQAGIKPLDHAATSLCLMDVFSLASGALYFIARVALVFLSLLVWL